MKRQPGRRSSARVYDFLTPGERRALIVWHAILDLGAWVRRKIRP